jgi:hypothetical protein
MRGKDSIVRASRLARVRNPARTRGMRRPVNASIPDRKTRQTRIINGCLSGRAAFTVIDIADLLTNEANDMAIRP